MKVQTKSVLILLCTLVLGILLGAVGVGALAQHRIERLRELRRVDGFVAHMESLIQPRDEAQRAAIRPHLEAMARRHQEIMRRSLWQLHVEVDSMKLRLAPLLDETQRERLEAARLLHRPFRRPFPPGHRGFGGAGGAWQDSLGERPGRGPGIHHPR